MNVVVLSGVLCILIAISCINQRTQIALFALYVVISRIFSLSISNGGFWRPKKLLLVYLQILFILLLHVYTKRIPLIANEPRYCVHCSHFRFRFPFAVCPTAKPPERNNSDMKNIFIPWRKKKLFTAWLLAPDLKRDFLIFLHFMLLFREWQISLCTFLYLDWNFSRSQFALKDNFEILIYPHCVLSGQHTKRQCSSVSYIKCLWLSEVLFKGDFSF